MLGFDSTKTHRSLALLVGVSAMLASATNGCIVVTDDDTEEPVVVVDDPPPAVETVPIDTGAKLEADPGLGAGVFVEYDGNGNWNVWATCDTEVSGAACGYDVFITGDALTATDEVDLEGRDFVEATSDGLHLFTDTDFDIDGVSFSGFIDDPVQIEVWVDGAPDPSLVFWVANGDIWEGMPTNPSRFAP